MRLAEVCNVMRHNFRVILYHQAGRKYHKPKKNFQQKIPKIAEKEDITLIDVDQEEEVKVQGMWAEEEYKTKFSSNTKTSKGFMERMKSLWYGNDIPYNVKLEGRLNSDASEYNLNRCEAP